MSVDLRLHCSYLRHHRLLRGDRARRPWRAVRPRFSAQDARDFTGGLLDGLTFYRLDGRTIYRLDDLRVYQRPDFFQLLLQPLLRLALCLIPGTVYPLPSAM